MLYLANASSEKIRDAMRAGRIGMMTTPNEGRAPLPGVQWAADNGCFSTHYVGDTRWIAWLRRHAEHASRCLFATAPDVVGHAAATLARSAQWLPIIRELGYPAALVAQDGLEDLTIPWTTFDVIFIGGSTAWKLSPAAADIATQARRRGKPVHMGPRQLPAPLDLRRTHRLRHRRRHIPRLRPRHQPRPTQHLDQPTKPLP